MKNITAAILAMALAVPMGAQAISTSAFHLDGYGYEIFLETSDDLLWEFSLENISTINDPLIDAFGMNLDAELGTDFSVQSFNPDTWSFASPTGGGIQFDYIGDTTQDGRLASGDLLTFEFLFNTPTDYNVWTDTLPSLGTGFGGGEDFGQVAVSFQQLDFDGEGSDLLASNWEWEDEDEGDDPAPVPVPPMLWLFGAGLIGLGLSQYKKKA